MNASSSTGTSCRLKVGDMLKDLEEFYGWHDLHREHGGGSSDVESCATETAAYNSIDDTLRALEAVLSAKEMDGMAPAEGVIMEAMSDSELVDEQKGTCEQYKYPYG